MLDTLVTAPTSDTEVTVTLATGQDASTAHANTAHHAKRAVIVAMCFNLAIAASKLLVSTFVTKSSALMAEGLHSAADAFNSFTLLYGLLQGQRPPDRSHPYGYGLETNFWALMASFMLFASAGYSIYEGWHRLHQAPEALQNVEWAIALLVLNVAFELGAVHAASTAVLQEVQQPQHHPVQTILDAFKHIRRVKSPTTRFVFLEDIVALVGAGVALLALVSTDTLVRFEWIAASYRHWPDAIASMLIGGMLLLLAFNLFRYNRNFLTVAAASVSVEQTIRGLVLGTHGISTILDLKTIDQGLAGLFIQLKIEVDPDIPVRDVDDLVDHLKDRLQSSLKQPVRDIVVEVVADESDQVWEDVLDKLIDQGEEQEIIKPTEANLFRNMLEFSEQVLSDVMIPRTEVVMLDVTTSLDEAVDTFLEHRHSKIPVYEDTNDNVLGVLHERDVLYALRRGETDIELAGLLQELPIYPENKPLSDVLEEFRKHKVKMVAVIDEHGGFAGLVTLSDILSELVGELWEDDIDTPEQEILTLSATEWLIDGRVDVEDLNDALGLNLPDEDFKTLGGFVFGLIGREPEEGDDVTFEHLHFKVLELDGHRIAKIQLQSDWPLLDS